MLSKVGLGDKVNFYRLMAVTLKSGLGIRQSLEAILYSEQNPYMRNILNGIIDNINRGTSFSDALANYKGIFSDSEIALISSAEEMGNLPDVMEGIANELESFQAILSKIKNSMIYPVVVIFLAIGASIVLLTKVMPKIVAMFPSQDNLPGITVFMLSLSDYLQNNWLFILLILIAIPVGYIYAYNNILPFKIIMDEIYLKLPVISSLVRMYHHYRFSKLLVDFYKAGISPVSAMGQIADILPNYHYKEKVLKVKKDLELGLGFLDSMEGSSLFDTILIQILGIGEKTGNIEIVLDKVGEFYKNEFSNRMEGLTRVLEPLLMAFVAGLIGLIVASIFLPLAELINNIG